MLRITRVNSPGTITLKLEGRLIGPWVDELEAAVGRALADARAVRLDLDNVSFADADGTRTLRKLVDRGVGIAACSNFVAELLHVEKP
jgi:anti-anti-sigma regulatory factor